MKPVAPVTKYFKTLLSSLKKQPAAKTYRGASEECGAAREEVVIDRRLDGLAHPLRELEHDGAVVGRLGSVPAQVEWFAELDPPLRRERDVRCAGEPRQQP